MVNQHHDHHIFDQRFHADGAVTDLFVKAVFIVDDHADQIRADKHQQDTCSGMNA